MDDLYTGIDDAHIGGEVWKSALSLNCNRKNLRIVIVKVA